MSIHPDPDHSTRNLFGVATRYGTEEDLAGSKLPHVMRLREDPRTGRPGVAVRFRK